MSIQVEIWQGLECSAQCNEDWKLWKWKSPPHTSHTHVSQMSSSPLSIWTEVYIRPDSLIIGIQFSSQSIINQSHQNIILNHKNYLQAGEFQMAYSYHIDTNLNCDLAVRNKRLYLSVRIFISHKKGLEAFLRTNKIFITLWHCTLWQYSNWGQIHTTTFNNEWPLPASVLSLHLSQSDPAFIFSMKLK